MVLDKPRHSAAVGERDQTQSDEHETVGNANIVGILGSKIFKAIDGWSRLATKCTRPSVATPGTRKSLAGQSEPNAGTHGVPQQFANAGHSGVKQQVPARPINVVKSQGSKAKPCAGL